MNLIAWGLAVHHPAAYALIFILLYPPIFIIIDYIIDKIKILWYNNYRKKKGENK